MNELFDMFLVSDVANFGDIILDELTAVMNGEKETGEFSGNIFDLSIRKDYATLTNLLDERMAQSKMRTRYLYALVKSEVASDF
ncbi:hypothetical protein KG089_03715 [Carnobacteriaceae bacterium zg-ZUI252]|nr:hypothetical protein [Carnobacteriaceae bacterium zg-ZUI252]MBS4769587.1 hypothetical protein [Carnobacteriaceae bacterium zg-ZUI240]QTU83050.1 hypothetical protein J7S27_00565 [Carnobacteriaceae bacterium zg-C25]